MMPDFISLFISELNKKKPLLSELLIKKGLKERPYIEEFIKNLWHSLPESYNYLKNQIFAVDASQRTLSFSLGPYLLITQALAIGSQGYEKALVSIEPILGSTSETQLNLVRDLIMQDLEIQLALQIVKDNPHPLSLLVDGSILSRISYLLRYIGILEEEKYKNLAFNVLTNTLELINLCKKNSVNLISISKSSRNTFFLQIMSIDNPKINEEIPYKPTDTELLTVFTTDTGYTTPLLIGAEIGLGHKQLELIEKDLNIQNMLNSTPAFYTFYIRLLPRDQFLRIDFPGYMVNDDSSILSVNYYWGKNLNVDNIIALLKENCINSEIYQTPLYLVDRIVRIRREPDLERYILILKKEFPGVIEIDRSQRRFY